MSENEEDDPAQSSLSTALSCGALATTSFVLLSKLPFRCTYLCLSLGTSLFSSIVGLIRYSHPDQGGKEASLYNTLVLFTDSVAFPLYATELFINYNYGWEVSVAHSMIGVLPLVYHALNQKDCNEAEDFMLSISTFAVLAVSALKRNYFAGGASLVYLLGRFMYNQNVGTKAVKCRDFVNFCNCIFYVLTYFSVQKL